MNEYTRQSAERTRDQIIKSITEPRFLNLSKKLQKENLLSLIEDYRGSFIQPLIERFETSFAGIYTREELDAFTIQIQQPGGIYDTFSSGLVQINGKRKLPQVVLFLRTTGDYHLEALAEILHSLRLLDIETEQTPDKKKKSPASTRRIPFDFYHREALEELIKFYDGHLLTLPSEYDFTLFFGQEKLSQEQVGKRGRIQINGGLTTVSAFLKHISSTFGCRLVEPGVDRELISDVFDYVNQRTGSVEPVNGGSIGRYINKPTPKEETEIELVLERIRLRELDFNDHYEGEYDSIDDFDL